MRSKLGLLLAALCIGWAGNSQAVILYRSATRNTSAPTGIYANSGWQYQIPQGNFLGTPIGPHTFLTAGHIAPGTGFTFGWNNSSYTVTGGINIAGTDLAIRTVNNTFPTFAGVYDESKDGDLTDKTITIFGRGTQRGAEINLATVPRDGESTLRGWQWGAFDSVQSWGTNTFAGTAADESGDPDEYIAYNFSRNGTSEEGTISSGDSGGAVFAKSDQGVWKLVGINYGVDCVFRQTDGGSDIYGAYFDQGNLYQDNASPNDSFYPDEETDLPTYGYSSNVTHYKTQLAPYIPKPGDANFDGKVDAMDFSALVGHYGTSSVNWADGDFNHDGFVNTLDFNLLAGNFGYVGTPPAGALLGSSVPEPTCVALIAMLASAGFKAKPISTTMTKMTSFSLAFSTLLLTAQCSAVILYRSETRNTSVPTGVYAGSGWQYEMRQGSYLGTPIGPHAFVTAGHIAPDVGAVFNWNGASYTAVARDYAPGTDIAYITVSGTFPYWAPLYDEATDGEFKGKEVVIIGRGTQRGPAVNLASPPRPGESTFRGWEGGTFDAVQSWGTNIIEDYAQEEFQDPKEYFYANFSQTGGTSEEGMVSNGDSGGGVFIRAADGVWKLAGISSTVDGPFRMTATSEDFRGVMVDYGGLYWHDRVHDLAIYQDDTVEDQPSNGYFSNVTHYLSYINPFVPTLGDANLDGGVNTLDFNLLAGHFGQSTPNWASGDFNHDGLVSSIDFDLLISHYGLSGPVPLGGATGISVGANVPEPATIAAFALLVPALRRPRKHQL